MKTQDAINAVVEANIGLARWKASQWLATRTRCWPDTDEIHAAALRGLWDAARLFDASKGIPFHAYASRRIVGEILDWCQSEYGDAKRVAKNPRRIRRLQYIDLLPVAVQDRGMAALLARDEIDHVMSALLPRERESYLAVMMEGLTQKEAACRLEISESRVSQILKDTAARLAVIAAGRSVA